MPLKIYFCDSCNESIPLKDLHSNRITFDAGKIFCAGCAPKRPLAVSRLGAGVIAGAIGFAALAGIAFLGGREIQRGLSDTAAVARAAARLEAEVNRLRADAFTRAECERMIAPLAESAEKVRKDFAAVEERLRNLDEGLRGSLAKLDRDVAEAAGQVGELRSAAGQAGRTTAEQTTIIAALKAEIDVLKSGLADLSRKLDAAPGPDRRTPTTDAGPSEPTVGPEDAELRRLASMLKEADAGRRYEAVNGLANLHATGAVEALEGALGDGESYVRDAAVRALRRHASLKSVPKIIGVLRDSDLFVRTSAKAALKQLVGVEPAFDPDADQARREKGVKDFEAWWAANAEKFLGK